MIDAGTKTIPMPTALIAQFIEEKMHQFGFTDDDIITKIELVGLPKTIMVKVKSKKEKEVQVITHDGKN